MLYTKQARSTSMDEVLAALEVSAARHQMGVLGVHDLQQKMLAKGVSFETPCRVVEVCNPQQARTVLLKDMNISTALPCRISLYQQQGRITLATLLPTQLLALFNQPELTDVARQVEEAMVAMINEAAA